MTCGPRADWRRAVLLLLGVVAPVQDAAGDVIRRIDAVIFCRGARWYPTEP